MISGASPGDAARVAELLRLSMPERVVTTAGVRYYMDTARRPEDRMEWWRAESGGELVGWASGGLDAFAPDRTTGHATVVVHPSHRRGGVGSGLWEAVSAHLDGAGARRILAHGHTDDDTKSFAAARGFRIAGTISTSALDPRSGRSPWHVRSRCWRRWSSGS